jgi:P-type conjugative transfer protein TrbJ
MRLHHRVTLTWLASVLAALPFVCTPEASAQFVVEDPFAIGKLAQQIAQGIQQIKTTQQQLDQLRAAARQLDPRSYQNIQALLSGDDVNYLALTRDVSTIGYTLDRVNTQFAKIFPTENSVHDMHATEHEATAVKMREEVYNAGLVSARAQSTLENIETNNAEARAILDRSAATDSQVAQLQSALQMLALIHQNLVNITMAVNAAGRVSSDIAAQAVVERRIQQEKRRRMFEDYRRREDIPEIDSRALRER